MRTIPSINTIKTIQTSHTVRAIKEIWPAIRSERSKQYDQRYNQDNPRGGNGYIVSSTYQRSKQKPWCSGGWCRMINSGAIPDSICWLLVLLLTDIYVWLLKSLHCITPPISKCRSLWATCMPPACDLSTWPLHVTSPRDPSTWPWCSLFHLRSWVDWTHLHDFAKSTTFLECQRSMMSAHAISRDFFRSR